MVAAARTAGLSVEEIVRGDDIAIDVQRALDNDARTLALLALLAALGAASVPWIQLAIVFAAGLALAVVAAGWPASKAARAPIAESLRSE